MNRNLIKKIIQAMFIGVIAVLLAGSLVRAYISPLEINYYENRKANQPPVPAVRTFLNAEFQDGLEEALSDQVLFSGRAKKLYNQVESRISYAALRGVYDANPGKYFVYNNILVFNSDYLLFYPRFLDDTYEEAIA